MVGPVPTRTVPCLSPFHSLRAEMAVSYSASRLRTWGSTGIDQTMGVAADANGNVAAVGSFFAGVDFGAGVLNSAGSADAFLVRLTP